MMRLKMGLVSLLMVSLIFCSFNVSAQNETEMVYIDIPGFPEQINEHLFGGNNLLASKLFIAMIFVLIAFIILALAGASVTVHFLAYIIVILFLVALGWLDSWVIAFVAIIGAALLANKISDIWARGGGTNNG